ncbi:MAG: hypothetical protein A3G75_03290 [Verrucomicrobia bacterium RIFCSPLOWO2_12_FULL_64_8]|nr:MAG: hypothetical protein A3G75_03290 [Verrucomicrobia bacterium RIFCSPLOWO2_12_FULL_64_8]
MRPLGGLRFFLALVLARVVTAAEIDALARVLLDSAKDNTAKGEACQQLMELGPAAAPAVPALVALLKSKDEVLRDYAVTTLGRIGPAAGPAIDALRDTSAHDPSPAIRGLAREAIDRIGTGQPASTAGMEPAQPGRQAAKTPANPAQKLVRPPLVVRYGRYFRWSAPEGWKENETINGVTLGAPDRVTSVSSALLLRATGGITPADFTLRMVSMMPGTTEVRTLSVKNLPDQLSGRGTPWKVQEIEMTYHANGTPLRATWTTGIVPYFGAFDAFMLGYQAPVASFDEAKLWLAPIARSIIITNPRQVAGNDTLVAPRNNPLDNSSLIESWRQKGLSEARISQARREATMGYERAKDPETGRIYEMPLETWDGTAGGYRNPQRPTEILQPTEPGE